MKKRDVATPYHIGLGLRFDFESTNPCLLKFLSPPLRFHAGARNDGRELNYIRKVRCLDLCWRTAQAGVIELEKRDRVPLLKTSIAPDFEAGLVCGRLVAREVFRQKGSVRAHWKGDGHSILRRLP